MGGTAIVSKEALFSAANEIRTVKMKNLKAWHYIRQTEEFTVHNWAPDQPDGVIVGEPVYFNTHVAMKGLEKFLQLGVGETNDFTWLVAAQVQDSETLADAAHRPTFMGNYNGSSGASIYISSNGARPAGAPNAQAYSVAGTNNARSFAQTTVDEFNLYGLVYDSAAPSLKLANYSLNLSDVTPVVVSTDRTGKGGGLIRVGSAYGAFAGFSRVAFAAVWDTVLTDEEVAKVKAQVLKDLSFESPTLVFP